MLDARKPLTQLHSEWGACTACELGGRRAALQKDIVFGEGAPRGLMFIGEGPGKLEEQESTPFVGPAGDVLRKVIHKFGIEGESYLTNLVSCRSCMPVTDEKGNVRLDRNKLPMLQDQPPTQLHINACRDRLLQQIYIVDPVIIITLGVHASEALLGHPVAITRDRGTTEPARFVGVTEAPSLTDKKGVWARKVGGQLMLPTEPFEVEYLVMPTLHPAYILRRGRDNGPDNPLKEFVGDIRNAVRIYQQYMSETFNVSPNGLAETVIEMEEFEDFELWRVLKPKTLRVFRQSVRSWKHKRAWTPFGQHIVMSSRPSSTSSPSAIHCWKLPTKQYGGKR